MSDILVLTILAVICGADSWVDVESFGHSKEEWLKTFLLLPNGIPSHDTIGRLFSLLDAKQLQRCFVSWVNSLVASREGEIVGIDGKTLRRSGKLDKSKAALHLISAWAVNNRLVLGQLKSEHKANEVLDIPKLIDMLDIKGTPVTIDAAGCKKAIAEKIIKKGADYILSLKGNSGKLHAAVRDLYVYAFKIEKDHGRIEKRSYGLINKPNGFSEKTSESWPGLKGLGMSTYTHEKNGEVITEERFYLLSFGGDAKRFARVARSHWNIEINLHWSLWDTHYLAKVLQAGQSPQA